MNIKHCVCVLCVVLVAAVVGCDNGSEARIEALEVQVTLAGKLQANNVNRAKLTADNLTKFMTIYRDHETGRHDIKKQFDKLDAEQKKVIQEQIGFINIRLEALEGEQ